MALLAGYAVLLHRHTGQTDLAIGVPTSGRDRPGTATVLGPCDDALVIRVDLGGDPGFATLVRRVAQTALDAYSHPDVPFAVLAEQLRADGHAHPLFQASIVLQQRPSLLDPAYSAELMSRQPIGNVWISGFAELPRPPTALDLELAMFDSGDGLEAVLTGRADVLDETGIERLAAGFGTLLAELTEHPDRPLSELEPSDLGPDQARSGSSPALIV
jgi:non-ribosomal peptide synthetase component F